MHKSPPWCRLNYNADCAAAFSACNCSGGAQKSRSYCCINDGHVQKIEFALALVDHPKQVQSDQTGKEPQYCWQKVVKNEEEVSRRGEL